MTTTPDPLDRSTLVRLTVAKAVANTALRWVPPFLPTLERAFGVSTTQLTTVLGAGELAGLSTLAVGPHLDRGRERIVMVGALTTISISSVVALGGTLTTFAIAFVLLILGVANYTVAGHALISHRVDYRWRARSIGLFETSWAVALLVGGPLIAVLINLFGWRGPFVFLAIGCGLAAVLVAATLPRVLPPVTPPAVPPVLSPVVPPVLAPVGTRPDGATAAVPGRSARNGRQRITLKAWLTICASATMATAGLSVFVISGSWLDDAFGVSTGGLGYIVMGFGAIELIASVGTATYSDRFGKMRSTLGGVVALGGGLVIMLAAGDRLALGVVGLLVFLVGFEYGFVTSLSLVSEAMPDARGATLALGNAVATVARSTGAIASGWLFGAYGIAGTAALSAAAATVSAACLLISRRAS